MYGTTGGYGGYSSSYGTSGYGGYGGYGSMGSMGSMGSYSSSSYGSPYSMNRNPLAQNQADPNALPNAQSQQVNKRRVVMQEYFKMMGGLRSMVQIGFSLVALCNFTSRSWDLLKKIIVFLSGAVKSLMSKVGSIAIPKKLTELIEKTAIFSGDPQNNPTVFGRVMLGIRLAAAVIILIGIKLSGRLRKEADKEHEQLLKKYDQIKMEEAKITQEEEHRHNYEWVNQKQGYF